MAERDKRDIRCIVLKPGDSVAVLPEGERRENAFQEPEWCFGKMFRRVTRPPFGAFSGEPVIKYGHPMGRAAMNIVPGKRFMFITWSPLSGGMGHDLDTFRRGLPGTFGARSGVCGVRKGAGSSGHTERTLDHSPCGMRQ